MNAALKTSHTTPRGWLVVTLQPLLYGVVTAALVWSWRHDLPDPLASHWGTDGVDGFMTLRESIVFGVLIQLISIVTGVLIYVLSGGTPGMSRFAGAFSGGLAAFVATVDAGSVWIQRGLTDARQAPDVEWTVAGAVAVAFVAGAVGWWLMPRSAPLSATSAPVPSDAPRLPLAPGQAAAWSAFTWTKAGTWIAVASILGMVVMGVVIKSWVVPLVIAVGLLLAQLALTAFRVTVGANGLTVRSVIGLPCFKIPLDQLVAARVVDIDPMGQFGGWGIRASFDGRSGVVLMKGPAIEVERTDGSKFVVTVPDAGQGAALLNTLADRVRVG